MDHSDKLDHLRKIFGTHTLFLSEQELIVNQRHYPIIDDIIILLPPEHYTLLVRKKLGMQDRGRNVRSVIQYTFGKEWEAYSSLMPEHKSEFESYFDLVTLDNLKDKVVCDLGCGNGRWSHFIHDKVKTLIMIDFSDAIFVARGNLSAVKNAIFIMADLQQLPMRMPFADFLFCLGVLHHLPSSCLSVVRSLKDYSDEILIYLYYSLDNKQAYFKYILEIISPIRLHLARIQSKPIRNIIAKTLTIALYYPCILIGTLLKPLKLSHYIPIYDGYHGKSFARIEQDVYDHFFTSIEQRVSRKEIQSLMDTYSEVIISDNVPYWHFLLKR